MMKIKWKNVIRLMYLVAYFVMLIHDFYLLAFKGASYSWLGFITLILGTILAGLFEIDLEEQIKSTSNN